MLNIHSFTGEYRNILDRLRADDTEELKAKTK
jgi:hypothetical protein